MCLGAFSWINSLLRLSLTVCWVLKHMHISNERRWGIWNTFGTYLAFYQHLLLSFCLYCPLYLSCSYELFSYAVLSVFSFKIFPACPDLLHCAHLLQQCGDVGYVLVWRPSQRRLRLMWDATHILPFWLLQMGSALVKWTLVPWCFFWRHQRPWICLWSALSVLCSIFMLLFPMSSVFHSMISLPGVYTGCVLTHAWIFPWLRLA